MEGDGELQAAHLPIKEEKREDGISTLDILDVTKEDVEVEELLVKERKNALEVNEKAWNSVWTAFLHWQSGRGR